MEDTIILNTNKMLPSDEEFNILQEQAERSKILNITNTLDELLNTKNLLKASYNYQTDNAEELKRFSEMFKVEGFNFTSRTIELPNAQNRKYQLFISNIYWSDNGLTIEGKDITNNQNKKISIKQIDNEFFWIEYGIIRPIRLTLYPDIYEIYLIYEKHLNTVNQIIETYQKCFNTLEGLVFLNEEVRNFMKYCSTGYPIDNLFAICFKTISNRIKLENKDIKEYLNYIVNIYANYLFFFDEVKTWKKYLLDGYIQDEEGNWKYHNLHYSRINKLTYNHYVPVGSEFFKKELQQECDEAINTKNDNCTYSLSKIKRSNLIK